VPDLLHPFFAQVAKEISVEVRKKGYSLFISSSDEDPALERQEIEQLLARRVDVLVIASAQRTVDSFRRIEEQKVPYILFDRRFKELESNFIGVDDCAVGTLATRHLIEQGCRRIAHVRGPEISTAIGRLEGYKRALAEANLPFRADDIIPIGESGDHRAEPGGYEAARKLLANKHRPDGIFCFNDPVALGTMRAILDAGLHIPDDIAVVGCGNLSYSDFLRVPLSSIDQGTAAIARAAAALALRLAHSKVPRRIKSELIAPRLVVRTSSLCNPASRSLALRGA
jgi:LacI family transcriptional regulator